MENEFECGGRNYRARPEAGRIKEVLRDALEKTIRTWAFEPGKENGIPAATDTTLIVEMNIARKADDAGLSVVLVRAFTGGAIRKIGAMPAFSRSQSQAMKKDKKAKNLVVLRVAYDKLGVPEEIAIADGSPITKGVLVEAAIKAVKTWAFDPERIAGHGLRAAALVPICYQNEATDESYEECEWSSPNGDGSFIGRGSVALDSSVHLKTEVAGLAL